MKKYKVLISLFLVIVNLCICFSLLGCSQSAEYNLSINGGELLYENLKDSYKEGEEVTVKVKIRPYEGVNVLLDTKLLAKSKSTQNDFWQFTFNMPSHDAVLDITSYKRFNEPLLSGFYLTFNDKNGKPIEAFNKDINSKDAITHYMIINYDDNDVKHISNNIGADVLAESNSAVSDNKIEFKSTLYFTYELLDSVAILDWVYLDEKQEIYSYGSTGYQLNYIGYTSAFNNQNLSDIRYNSQMKEYEEKFDSYIKLNFKYLDYLTGVKVLEYGANNELIKSTDIIKSEEKENTYIVSENCEYAVIEEEYTVMYDERKKGEKYYERTLINKSKLENGKTLKYPRGDGLILPKFLSIKWAE